MKIASQQLMRISFLLMVFHFLAPQPFANGVPEFGSSKETVYQVQLHAIATPVLLKEKDEKKVEGNAFEHANIPLLDLTAHGLNLQARHSTKIFYFHSEIFFNSGPPLFTVLQTFVI